jgi:hypothetical protein
MKKEDFIKSQLNLSASPSNMNLKQHIQPLILIITKQLSCCCCCMP